jgi:hypothetical protein
LTPLFPQMALSTYDFLSLASKCAALIRAQCLCNNLIGAQCLCNNLIRAQCLCNNLIGAQCLCNNLRRYDRIMNAARRLEIIQDASKKYKQAEVLKSIIALLGQIVSAYDMPFHIDSHAAPSDHAHGRAVHSNSLALHLAPGQTAWTASGGDESGIDMTSGDAFFGFMMNLASRLDPAVLVDIRTHAAAQHLVT